MFLDHKSQSCGMVGDHGVRLGGEPIVDVVMLPQSGRGGFKVYGFDLALLGPQNYESDWSSFVAVPLLDFSGFFCRLGSP